MPATPTGSSLTMGVLIAKPAGLNEDEAVLAHRSTQIVDLMVLMRLSQQPCKLAMHEC